METTKINEAIGKKIIEILNLHINKKTGMIKTEWGNKTVQGLGAAIICIVQEESNCIPKDEYDKAILEINKLQYELTEALDDTEN